MLDESSAYFQLISFSGTNHNTRATKSTIPFRLGIDHGLYEMLFDHLRGTFEGTNRVNKKKRAFPSWGAAFWFCWRITQHLPLTSSPTSLSAIFVIASLPLLIRKNMCKMVLGSLTLPCVGWFCWRWNLPQINQLSGPDCLSSFAEQFKCIWRFEDVEVTYSRRFRRS